MKIKLYLLALDHDNCGTEVSWFYTEKDRYAYMIDIFGDHESPDHAKAVRSLEDGDIDAVEDFLAEHGEGISATWQTDNPIIETDLCEKTTS